MKKIIVFAFSVFLFWGTAWAAKITAQDALVAAQRWITITDAAPLNAKFARSVPTVRTIGGDTGKDLFHIVEMAGGGFVVMPADDRISPIVAFSSTGTVVEDDENPLWDMLSTDLRAAMAAAEDGGTVSALGSRKGSTTDNPTAQWKALLSDDAVARKGGLANVTEWVAPLLKSKWDQTKVGSKNVYNYYTPGHYPCGCVATAMAQLLRYHEYPTASITPQAFTCTVSGVATNTMMMGGAYAWTSMPEVPKNSITDAQRQAIGKLTHDCAVTMRMNFDAQSSGACGGFEFDPLTKVFRYANARSYINGSGIDTARIQRAICTNLDAKLPVLLGILTANNAGHSIVADGYGYVAGAQYFHLNMGWSGTDDVWYSLPSVETSQYNFTRVNSVVYNVYPTKITAHNLNCVAFISGRVLDAQKGVPLAGATVTAVVQGDTFATATTSDTGVYALQVPEGMTSYIVSATKEGFEGQSSNVSIAYNYNPWSISFNPPSYILGTMEVGNSWGNNFTLTELSQVAFDGNGHTSGTPPAPMWGAIGGELTLPDPGTLQKTGYLFEGWCINADGSGTKFQPGRVLSGVFVSQKRTFYAIWKCDMPNLTIASAHGASNPAVGTHAYVRGSTVNVSVPGVVTDGLTRYTCTGWVGSGSVSPTGTGTNTSFVITNDSTLTWCWSTNVLTLAQALNADHPDLEWSTTGDYNWFPVWTTNAADGVHAARAGTGPFSGMMLSYLKVMVTGPGVLRFKWRISCSLESTNNGFIYLDSDGLLEYALVGETNWSEVSLDIPAGSHRVVWLYFKIKDSQTGDDTLWVDNVRWEPTSRLDVIVPDGTSSTVIEKIKAAATNAIPTAVAITVSPENLEKLELLDVTPTFTAGEGGTNAVDDIQVKFETALTFDPLTVTTRILDTSGMNPLTTTPAAQVVVYGRETLTNGWSQVGSSISEAKSSFSTTETGVDRLSDSRYKFFKFKVEPKLQQP